MAVSQIPQLGCLGAALLGCIGAALGKPAAGQLRPQGRNGALDGEQLPLVIAVNAGHGLHESLGIGMGRMAEQFRLLGVLHNLAGVHHVYFIADVRHHAQVVGNHQNRGVVFLLQMLHQRQNLCLHRHIQGSGWLIRNQKFRVQHHGHGNADALPQSAGKLVGVGAVAFLRVGDAHVVEHLNYPALGLGLSNLLVEEDCLPHLLAHGDGGIQGGHRLLENHADFAAPHLLHFLFGAAHQIPPFKFDAAFLYINRLIQQAHEAAGGHTLAAAGFTHQANGFALGNVKIDSVHRMSLIAILKGNHHTQPLDGDNIILIHVRLPFIDSWGRGHRSAHRQSG